MRRLFIIIGFILFCITITDSLSQGLHTSSSKALKAYNTGVTAFDYLDYPGAERFLMDAIIFDEKFYEAYMMLGELMSKQKRYSEASIYYRSAIKIDSLFYKPVFFSIAIAEMMSGDYSKALIHFNVYLDQKGMSEKNKLIAFKKIKDCEFAINAIKSPVLFNPVSLGNAINTSDDEYWPSITADGHTIMFTRQPAVAVNQHFGQVNEDFYLSYFSGAEWQKAVNAGAPLNTSQNEGAQTLSSNGAYMFFTACDRLGGSGSCDIFFSAYVDGKWTEPSNLGSPVNTPNWESQPSISADGNTLFFSSSRPGGKGGKDIWFTVLDEKYRWSDPVNMGESVNTDGDEMSPFIHFDGKTLYFASDGLTGLGGFDIFMVRMKDDNTWEDPVNLGYPINTFNDEMGLVIESGGQKAYFSSKRDNQNGKDIFFFDLYEDIRPAPVSYLKGTVLDKETGKLLKADYELINLSTNKVTLKSTTDGAGNFLVCLPSGYNYGINVSKTGYLFYSESFMFEGQHTVIEPFIKRISLNPVKIGEKMQLSNVFYEIDSWQLKKESVSELNNLVRLLLTNKNVIVEIGGFTDSTGSTEYNQVLSEKRALSVVNYLVDKGIQSVMLKYKGYGNAFPIGDNVTDKGRQLNRRTEVKIIGFIKQ